MERQCYISLYLDTRRAKASGKYPVRLRVFTSAPRKQKLYPTVFEFSPDDFASIWETTKPREVHKEMRKQMRSLEMKAIEAADSIKPFSFEVFERKLYRKSGEGENVFWHYEKQIEELKASDQIGTASNYDLSLKSLKAFIEYQTSKTPKTLLFSDITASWLNKYEQYMMKEKGRSHTTVSFYVRALRTLFNAAIRAKDIDESIYPFGPNGYQIPSVKRVKKSLNRQELKTLFDSIPQSPEQEKAKAFWFFSYSCNGMNVKDIALLRYEQIEADTMRFLRAKTINTSKDNLREVVVYLTDYAKAVIEKYGNADRRPNQYVFPILTGATNEVERRKRIQNFTRFINQNFKKLAVAEGITADISTYWARHSFATNAIRQGASMEFVSEALNHSNAKTTRGYFAGFEDSAKKELGEQLMNF